MNVKEYIVPVSIILFVLGFGAIAFVVLVNRINDAQEKLVTECKVQQLSDDRCALAWRLLYNERQGKFTGLTIKDAIAVAKVTN